MDETKSPLLWVRRNWVLQSLLPYAWLAAGASAVSLLGSALLGWPGWVLLAMPGFALLGLLLDPHWRPGYQDLACRLDCSFPQLHDSTALLSHPAQELAPLARLQRQRVERALNSLIAAGQLRRFHAPPLRSAISSSAGACMGLLLYVATDGFNLSQAPLTDTFSGIPAGPASAVTLHSADTLVQPPRYTGLPKTPQTLQVTAPENSTVTWQVTLTGPVTGLTMRTSNAEFEFTPGGPPPSDHWSLSRRVDKADFYQLSASIDEGQVLYPPIYTIDVVPDRAPEFEFHLPRDTVTVMSGGDSAQPRYFPVDVTVSDDFQVERASLVMTLASGSGENIRFRDQSVELKPAATDDHSKRFTFELPLESYAIEPGDEIYWFLQAQDNRQPEANITKSQRFILRWPHEEIFGLSDAEGMAVKVLPEYFRSQRQLIIDTEALLAEREQITPMEFRTRSETLAFEQNLLRMRYGRFLGEEDADIGHQSEEGDDTNSHDQHEEHHGEGEHAETSSGHKFGVDDGIAASVGHQHDHTEHATLFDPATKSLLRSALNAMWSAWRELAVIEPAASLPHQHSALRYIKEVQQASRIYLQRVGFEPPPIDESRRLSGERGEIRPAPVAAQQENTDEQQLQSLLQAALGSENFSDDVLAQLQALPQVQQQPELALELAKTWRLYRQDQRCEDCRRQLAAFLYGLLPAPEPVPALPRTRREAGVFADWLTHPNKDSGR
ncbi:hypothetical protein [Microbulbifer sp. TYP-18]|uniref:hypothetical protein n=1 Tax=Microbulbifer sp. TYP-18 TaxID=3230024 RepID=UPI0034C68A75